MTARCRATSRSLTPFERSEPLPGLRLVTESMPHVRSVSIGFWIDVGSRDESDDISGAAHFLEHLLFKGTPSRSAQDIANLFEAVGGDINAYSAREHTCFYARVLADDLPMAVEVLADMFRNAALRPDEVESERRVVLEEIRMASDVPEDRVHDVFASASWPGHPLGRPVLGTERTVGAMSVDQIRSFYTSGYLPERLVVAAAGDTTHEAVAGLLTGALAPGRSARRRNGLARPGFAGGKAAYEVRDCEQVHVVWGTEAFDRNDPDRYALSVFSLLYGGAMSSRLFQEVREKRGLAYSIFSGEHFYLETGSFTVYTGTQAETAPEVLKIVREEAAKVASGDLDPREVSRAKGHLRGALVLSMEDPAGRMTRLGRSELVHGEVLGVDDLLERVDAVLTEDVVRVAGRVFSGSPPAMASIGPVEAGALDFAVEPLAD